MLKHTPPDHKEHTELGQVGLLDIMMVMVIPNPQALNYMKNLNGEVNEAKRQQEEEERLLLQDEKDMAILGNLQRTIKSMKLESNQKLQVTEGQRRMKEGQRKDREGWRNSPPLHSAGLRSVTASRRAEPRGGEYRLRLPPRLHHVSL